MHDIDFLAKLAKEIGYLQEFSLLYQCGAANQHIKELMLTGPETRDVIRDIMKWKKAGYPIYTSYRVLDNALKWPFPYTHPHLSGGDIPKGFKPIPCYFGKTKFTIDADGYVYPCFPLIDEFKALNLKEVGLKRAMQHVIDTKKCSSCLYFTNNEHNLLLGLSLRQLIEQSHMQLKEIFGRY
jgi:MoaA/NifB/PqqE/SkfB family radical SAM enzyme